MVQSISLNEWVTAWTENITLLCNSDYILYLCEDHSSEYFLNVLSTQVSRLEPKYYNHKLGSLKKGHIDGLLLFHSESESSFNIGDDTPHLFNIFTYIEVKRTFIWLLELLVHAIIIVAYLCSCSSADRLFKTWDHTSKRATVLVSYLSF